MSKSDKIKKKRSSMAKMGKSIELERRHYYRKAVGLMTTGGLFLLVIDSNYNLYIIIYNSNLHLFCTKNRKCHLFYRKTIGCLKKFSKIIVNTILLCLFLQKYRTE